MPMLLSPGQYWHRCLWCCWFDGCQKVYNNSHQPDRPPPSCQRSLKTPNNRNRAKQPLQFRFFRWNLLWLSQWLISLFSKWWWWWLRDSHSVSEHPQIDRRTNIGNIGGPFVGCSLRLHIRIHLPPGSAANNGPRIPRRRLCWRPGSSQMFWKERCLAAVYFLPKQRQRQRRSWQFPRPPL